MNVTRWMPDFYLIQDRFMYSEFYFYLCIACKNGNTQREQKLFIFLHNSRNNRHKNHWNWFFLVHELNRIIVFLWYFVRFCLFIDVHVYLTYWWNICFDILNFVVLQLQRRYHHSVQLNKEYLIWNTMSSSNNEL